MGFVYLAHLNKGNPLEHLSDVDDDPFKIFVIIFGIIVSVGVAGLVYWFAK